jgi:hypothetical protein
LEGDQAALSSGYTEEIVMLVQREIMVGEKRDEIMWFLQPVAFTYHAMLRLWERGAGDGQTFHLMMADAFQRLRGVSALVELSCLLTKGTLPHHVAIPMLDGFIVASRRHTIVRSDDGRWGGRRNGLRAQMLNLQDEEYFIWEFPFETEGGQFTNCDRWFAATYMGANDLGGWERSLAAQRFIDMLRDVDLDHVARVREWAARPASKRPDYRFTFELPDLKEVMELQQEMLPRQDPADDRGHFVGF